MPTPHKAYYDSASYITALIVIFATYAVSVHVNKKRAHRISRWLWTFFIVWEVAYMNPRTLEPKRDGEQEPAGDPRFVCVYMEKIF